MKLIIIIIIIIILIIIYFYCDDFKYYIINKKGSKTVLLLGTIHGNEPAGSIALNKFIKNPTNSNIKFIVVPTVNRCGKFLCMRNNMITFDMNRYFKNNTFFNINKKIIKLMKQADFILDFHEGYDYHIINKKSIGSTLSPGNTNESYEVALKIINNLNNSINDNNKKFMILTNKKDLIKNNPDIYSNESIIPNTLDYYAKNNKYNYNYILIETTGINNKQPLEIRTNQIKKIINTVISHYSY
jgi:hypothetical protein